MTPNIDKFMDEIESVGFAVRVNVASGMPVFISAVSSEASVRSLQTEMARSEAARVAVLQRALHLTVQRPDERYENPWDAALAAYVLLLSGSDLHQGRTLAQQVSKTPGCWWAARAAEAILHPEGNADWAAVSRSPVNGVAPVEPNTPTATTAGAKS